MRKISISRGPNLIPRFLVVAVLCAVTPAAAAEETCFGRPATIVASDDVIDGTDGNDVIVAIGEVALILAGAGDDLVCGGREVDAVRGGAGDDKLSPGEGNDWRRAYGEAGDDLIVGAVDSGNRLDGGDGNDAITGGRYNDVINGGPGADDVAGGGDLDKLRGGPGADHLDGGDADDRFYPGRDDDSIAGGPGDDLVYERSPRGSTGTMGDEDIDGGAGRDLVWFSSLASTRSSDPAEVDLAAGAASVAGTHSLARVEDVSLFSDGPVRVVGDAEANRLKAFGSSAVVVGGAGDDAIAGGGGDDELKGGDGNDTVSYSWANGVTVDLDAGVAHSGGARVDQLSGFENIRGSCSGDSGHDVLLGDEGPNRIDGGCGNDRLAGRGGGDVLIGDSGVDVLDGDDGDDALDGGDGDDALDGGGGDDELDGGDGTDSCVNGETSRSCENP